MGKEIIDIDEQLRQLQAATEIVGIIDRLLVEKPEMFKRTAIYDTVKRYLKKEEVAIFVTCKLGMNDGVYSINVPGKGGDTVFCAEKVNGKIISASIIENHAIRALQKLFD